MKNKADLTDYQKECQDAVLKAGKAFIKAIKDYRDSFPFASYDGDAYVLGGWLASAFSEKERPTAWEAIEDGYKSFRDDGQEGKRG